MAKINIYLMFAGNTEEAFNFYKEVFGGGFSMVQRFKDTPKIEMDRAGMKESEGEKIMHISLPIGEGAVLMGSDTPESMSTPTQGDNFAISINTESKDEAEKVFTGLAVKGNIKMAMTDTFWGSYYGMVEDKFGINWMVSYAYPKT